MHEIIRPQKIPHLFKINSSKKSIATENLTPGAAVYGERVVNDDKKEYRIWDPNRSKMAALIVKGYIPTIDERSKVLYLGAASGTTASHISDLVSGGVIYAVEFSPMPMQNLIRVCESRMNMIPIFEDAYHPEKYLPMVDEVDMIYQDVAQREQAEIALLNSRHFLRMDGLLVLMLKARSIDSTARPRDVIEAEKEKLIDDFDIIKSLDLKPFHKDHVAIIARYGGEGDERKNTG
ncbi:MAG: fibrillarin-like rRNA/tRNA 2'-O-methyltransferase [Halobacteriota archaeon]|nr:fibrillarin-like rRNA/tRNA 2'-O-methyltransferase [Halobacteriota archaeon]